MSVTAPVEAPVAPTARPRAEVLRRAEGIELIGHFEDSGFREAPLLARRADGQVVQLTPLLYAVAEAADGRRDLHEIAARVRAESGRAVNASNVAFVAERKLRPLGVLALADGTTPELPKRLPVMALRHRRPLLPERAVNAGARLFTWLHRPAVVVAVLMTLGAFDVWLLGFHGIAGGLRRAIYEPILLLALFGSVIVATAFHEFGHASACRYGGARPGVMGVGLYLVWPAFYCDVTDAYRLGRRGRLRTDLGGVYFNMIFALLCGAAYFATGEQALLLAAFVQHVIALQQLLPMLRFDGFYVLSDLTGVPDIVSRVKPIFRSLVRGTEHEPRVAELKPWVRLVVTAYLAVIIPTMAFLFVWMVMGAPRIFATVWDSLGLQLHGLQQASDPAEAGADVLRMALLTLQVGAIALSVSRVGRLSGRGLTRWARGSAVRGAAVATLVFAVLGAIAYTWWPNDDYRPIGPGERGTLIDAIKAVPHAPGGRPLLAAGEAVGAVPIAAPLATPERRARGGHERPTRADGAEEGPQLTPVLDPDSRQGDGTMTDDGGGSWAEPQENAGSVPSTTSTSAPPSESPAPAPAGSETTTSSSEPAPTGPTASEPAPATAPQDTTTTTTGPEPAPADAGTTATPETTAAAPETMTTTAPTTGTTTTTTTGGTP